MKNYIKQSYCRKGNDATQPTTAYQMSIDEFVRKGGTRVGPIPGWQLPAKKNQTAPNGGKLSDGRYSVKGEFRTQLKNGKIVPRAHLGIDIPAMIGAPVYASAAGKVRLRGEIKGFGLVVVLRHNDGVETMYAHLSRQRVIQGRPVVIGEIVGYVGITGNAKNGGSHLHFQVMRWPIRSKKLGEAIDPLKWLKTGVKER